MGAENFQRFVRHAADAHALIAERGAAADKMAAKKRNIGTPLAQARHVNFHRVEPVKKILPQEPALY